MTSTLGRLCGGRGEGVKAYTFEAAVCVDGTLLAFFSHLQTLSINLGSREEAAIVVILESIRHSPAVMPLINRDVIITPSMESPQPLPSPPINIVIKEGV